MGKRRGEGERGGLQLVPGVMTGRVHCWHRDVAEVMARAGREAQAGPCTATALGASRPEEVGAGARGAEAVGLDVTPPPKSPPTRGIALVRAP